MVTAPFRRELVRWMQTKGLSERRGLAVAAMSTSSLRYEPRPAIPNCVNGSWPWRSGIDGMASR